MILFCMMYFDLGVFQIYLFKQFCYGYVIDDIVVFDYFYINCFMLKMVKNYKFFILLENLFF